MLYTQLIDHLNKLRSYLGMKEFLPNKIGTIQVELDDASSLEFRTRTNDFLWQKTVVILHTWDVSYHNGDFFNHQTKEIGDAEVYPKLQTMKHALEAQVKDKIKRELEQEAIKNAMEVKGLSMPDDEFKALL